MEINFTRRFSKGFALSAAYSGNRIRNLEFLNEYDRVPTLWQPNANGRPHRVTASGLAEIPFGPGGSSRAPAFLARFSAAGRSAARSNTSLDRSSRGATSSSTANSRTSPSDNPTLERWFNVDAGFERDPAKVPANFQKRVFPFRIDGVRGPNLLQVNMNFMRTVRLPGRRSLSFRVDIINLPNRTTFANPNLNPTTTDFGRITTATAASPRFIQFVTRLTF